MTDTTAPQEPMLRHFRLAHLPAGPLRDTSQRFANLAAEIADHLPASAERTVALRKLLEAKDAAVRCAVDLRDQDEEIAGHTFEPYIGRSHQGS